MNKRVYLNDGWEFTRQFGEELLPPGAGQDWTEVRLPHTCAQTPYDYFDESIYQMVCHYRRTLDVPASWAGKRLLLTIGAAGHRAEVYLDGTKLAEHRCGYTAFQTDLTDHVRPGGSHTLSIKVDSRESLDQPPFGYVIDYMTYGGIYRDAYLDVFEEAYLEDVFVSTVQMTGKRVRSRVKINAAKPLPEGESFVIRQSMKERAATEFVPICEKAITAIPDEEKKERRAARFGDDEGDGILYCATDADVSANEALGEIKLWELESPVLYVLKTELLLGDKVLDEREDTFGFRMAKFFRDGFYLNGKKVKLRGLNRHQSYPYMGYAAPKSLQVNDADILKHELGVNAVRTSHYTQSHYFLDRCDELGLLVFTEFPGWQHIGDEAWKE